MIHPTVKKIAHDIKSLKIQGAIHIALAAEEALQTVSESSSAMSPDEFFTELKEAAGLLKSTRPTAVALPNAIDQFMDFIQAEEGSVDELKNKAREFAENMRSSAMRSTQKIAELGADLIKDDMTILQHCHSSNVIAILTEAWNRGKKFTAICTETRPFHQGYISSRELAAAGIPTGLIVDSAAHRYMETIDMVLIGADTITKNGDLINKIGTKTITFLAQKYNKPVYVATQTLKFDASHEEGRDIPIEERPPEEIVDPKKVPGVRIMNPVFDVTPGEYITGGIITEKGIIEPHQVREILDQK